MSKIVRYVDQESGQAETVVHNDDGSSRSFGESSILSLVSSPEEGAKRMIDSLTDLELQGLVHELNKRLAKVTRDCQKQQTEYDQLLVLCDLAYFGLPEDATEKDLDKAYRRLAKKMHPDKMGSSDEAPDGFLELQERYERLKRKLRARDEERSRPQPGRENEDVNAMANEKGQVHEQPSDSPPNIPGHRGDWCSDGARPDASPKQEDQEKPDREALDEACWNMVRRTKSCRERLELLRRKIGDAQRELEEYRFERKGMDGVRHTGDLIKHTVMSVVNWPDHDGGDANWAS